MATKTVNTRMQQVVKTQAELNAVLLSILKGELVFLSDYPGIVHVGGVCTGILGVENSNKNGIAIGREAKERDLSVAIGYRAMWSSSVNTEFNVAIGPYALNKANATGSDNVAIGSNAMSFSTSGRKCVAIGEGALGQSSDPSLSVAIGFFAGGGSQGYGRATCLGANSDATSLDQVQLGGYGTTPYAYAALQIRSDARDKVDIVDEDLGVEFINKLRPIKHKWDLREEYRTPYPNRKDFNSDEEFKSAMDSYKVETFEQLLRKKDGSKKGNREHHGLIAQELKCTLDELGIDFAGYQDHSINGGEDVKSIAYEQFVPVLIKAVQELSDEIKIIKNK